MDAYLESLVRKDEVPAEPEVAETVEDIVADTTMNEPEVVFEDSAAKSEEALAADAYIDTNISINNPSKEAELEIETHKDGDIISVSNIRVFKTPDTNQVARNVSGNVVYRGKVADFTIVEYVKHGFGAVKGYTFDKI